MRKIVLYIAMSLDGYIADKNGGVDWLNGQEENASLPDTYSRFIRNVDTVIMGWKTYHQVVTELSPGEWVYSGLTSYIITHKSAVSTPQIQFTAQDPCILAKRLRKEPGKNIWICGGADIVRQLMRENLIDVYHICIIPVILGDGIRLFNQTANHINLKLTDNLIYNGITELVYERR